MPNRISSTIVIRLKINSRAYKMSNITKVAELFFEACETGKGWEACKEYCHPNATFSAQATALADINSIEDYTEWMKGRRMVVDGNKTYWNNRQNPSNTYQDFWKYMELIFMYAGTLSLEKERKMIKISRNFQIFLLLYHAFKNAFFE